MLLHAWLASDAAVDAASFVSSVDHVSADGCHNRPPQIHKETLSANTTTADITGTVDEWPGHLPHPLSTQQDDSVAVSTSQQVYRCQVVVSGSQQVGGEDNVTLTAVQRAALPGHLQCCRFISFYEETVAALRDRC